MPARTRGTAVAALVAAVAFIAGCTTSVPPVTPMGSGSPGPAATAAAAAVPVSTAAPTATSEPRAGAGTDATPSPDADVAAAFARSVASPSFEGAGPISGTVKIGPLTGTISGSLVLTRRDSAYDMTVTVPQVMEVAQSDRKVDGRSFTSSNGGPWFEVDAGGPGTNPASAALGLAAATARDTGVVSKLGRRLHHLVPASRDLSGKELGFGDAYADTQGTIEFYAGDDGSLAVLSLGVRGRIRQGGSETVPVEMAVDFTFDGEVPSAGVQVPDDVWIRFTSKRYHYSIGVPMSSTTVKSTSRTKPDFFQTSTGLVSAVQIERQPRANADKLDPYVRAFIAAEKRTSGHRPLTDKAVTALGRPARRLVYRLTSDGRTYTEVITLLVRGRDAYYILTLGPASDKDAVVALHEAQLGTFQLTGR